MCEPEMGDPFTRKDVEMVMGVDKLLRAWLAQSMSLEDVVRNLLHHLNSHEEAQESFRHQFIDLERRCAKMSSEIEGLRQGLREVKATLR